MISKEQIAHDLSIVYLNNKYGINVTGSFFISNGEGSGDIETEYLPDVNKPKKHKIKTGEKNFFGFDKKMWIDSDYIIDDTFINMIRDYKKASLRFIELIELLD